MGARVILLVLGAVVVGSVILLYLSPSGRDGEAAPGFDPEIAIKGLHPSFDPAEGRYVARCARRDPPLRIRAGRGVGFRVDGGPTRRGRARVRVRARPGEDFRIRVAEGRRARAYHVRCLPAGFPRWRFKRFRPLEDAFFVVSFRPRRRAPQWVIVFDTRGVPRWWYRPPTNVLWAQVLRDGTLSWARALGDGYGQDRRMAHEVRTVGGKLRRLVRTRGSIIDGHELAETRGGRVLVATYVPHEADLRGVRGPRRAAVVAAGIQELDRRGRVRWKWTSRGRIALRETRLRWWARVLANSRRRLGGLRTFDPIHINAIEPRGRREVIISSRHTDAVFGIRRATGNVAWKLGGRGRPGGLEVVGDPEPRRFGGQHDVRIADDGALTVYDNGKLRAYRPRVAFYRLELAENRARFVGQLRDPVVRSSHCCGSARELPAGGWVVSWGDNPIVTGFDRKHRLAFRLRLPAPTYRAVPAPEGAVTLAELDAGLERMIRRR